MIFFVIREIFSSFGVAERQRKFEYFRTFTKGQITRPLGIVLDLLLLDLPLKYTCENLLT